MKLCASCFIAAGMCVPSETPVATADYFPGETLQSILHACVPTTLSYIARLQDHATILHVGLLA